MDFKAIKSLDYQLQKNTIHWVVTSLYVIYLLVWIANYAITNGLKNKISGELNIFNKNITIVRANVDNRRRNVFYSTPDFFRKLTNMNDNITAVVRGTGVLSLERKTKKNSNTVERDISVILTSDRFFSLVSGFFKWGQSFNKSEFNTGKPVAVVGSSLASEIFGNNERDIKSVFINNYEFELSGEWVFPNDKSTESYSIIIPISTLKAIGDEDNTYVNTFIFSGNSVSELEKLKKTIDQLQLQAGYTPVRPEFEIINLDTDLDDKKIWYSRKSILDSLCWILIILLYGVGLIFWNNHLTKSEPSFRWRYLAGWSVQSIAREYTFHICKFLLSLIVSSIILSFLIMTAFKTIWLLDIGFGNDFHLSIFIFILSPIYFYFLSFKYIERSVNIHKAYLRY